MQFRELTHKDQLDTIDSSSELGGGTLIFKHSTRCAISHMAWNRFKRGWNVDEDMVPVYFLNLLRHRDISDAIASRYGVEHQSPQLLLIRKGECVYQASHNEIAPNKIEELISD